MFSRDVQSLKKKYQDLFSHQEKKSLIEELISWFRVMMGSTSIEMDVPSTFATLALLACLWQRLQEEDSSILNSNNVSNSFSSREFMDSFDQSWKSFLLQTGISRHPSTELTDAIRRLVEDFRQLSELDWSLEHLASAFLEHDVLGLLVQKTFRPRLRKRLAAHFTNLQAARALLDRKDLLCDTLLESGTRRCPSDTFLVDDTLEVRILDPFAGSGRLLMAVGSSTSVQSFLEETQHQKRSLNFYAVELHPLSAMACLLNLFVMQKHLSHKYARFGEVEINIFVKQGDAFGLFRKLSQDEERGSRHSQSLVSFVQLSEPNDDDTSSTLIKDYAKLFDVVVMNPPYTRYRTLEPSYRAMIKDLFHQESDLFDSHAGLHVFSLFLGERVLRKGGILLAVLPASILHARYAWSLKRYWIRHHGLPLVAAFTSDKAFSDGSEFREVTVILQKDRPSQGIRFMLLEPSTLKVSRLDAISRVDLEEHWNWLTFFLDFRVQQSFKQLSRSPLLVSASQLEGFRLLRGFEMYGPNFFFLPNSQWEIVSETSTEVIIRMVKSENGSSRLKSLGKVSSELALPKRVLGRTLRKPSLYRNYVTPSVSHWVFMPSHHDIDLEGVKDYISWGESLNLPAKTRFGSRWATHVHDQVVVKQPIGRVFIPDKVSLASHATLVHYLDEKMLASKNFYLFVRDYESKTTLISSEVNLAEKLLAAWMCSSLFLFLNTVQRREIGGSLGRLQIIDYMNNPLLLDVVTLFRGMKNKNNEFLAEWMQKTLEIFDTFRKRALPPIPQQLDDDHVRAELDNQFVTLLKRLGGIRIQDVTIREQLREMISDFASRDN